MKYIKNFTNFNESVFNEMEYHIEGEFDIDDVLDSYYETAFWTEGDNDFDNEIQDDNNKLNNKSISDISDKSKEQSKNDIIEFIKKAKEIAPEELSTYNEKSLGHNIWLSRNGHGAGFFDDNNDQLQQIARDMKSVNMYVGDDGQVYID